MVKVGIMSMQRIANYGSFLQAYGLKSILQEIGCDVEFVDYHPGKTIIKSDCEAGVIRKIFKVIDVMKYDAPLKDKIRFMIFKKNYGLNYYHYLGISEELNYSPNLDVLVIGSDEVFNCVQNNTNVGFSPELFGEDNNADKVITYAASFGNTTFDKLKKYHLDKQVQGWLKRMGAISVRDRNSGIIVKELLNSEPKYHLDPVLAYDYVNKCKEIPDTVPHYNYMILYGYSGRFTREECRVIRNYASKRKLRILCIGGVQDSCDEFLDCNPFEVIAYFQHAECIITDTFHGTILSIISHKPFVSVIRESGYGNSEKMLDLLERLALSERILEKNTSLEELLEKTIDYSTVEDILKRERQRTYIYLKNEIIK